MAAPVPPISFQVSSIKVLAPPSLHGIVLQLMAPIGELHVPLQPGAAIACAFFLAWCACWQWARAVRRCLMFSSSS